MKTILTLTACIAVFLSCCKNEKHSQESSFIAPEAGTRLKNGGDLAIQLSFGEKADSVVYKIDSTVALRRTDTSAVTVKSEGLAMGNHLVTAQIYRGGTPEEVTTNVVVLPSTSPLHYSYVVVNTYPHDTTSFTEGLEYLDGIFYESDGLYDESSLRTAALKTGKVIQQVVVPPPYFAEGIAVVGNKIIQLTYREHMGFVYDKKTLKKLSEFPYTVGREGWGLTFDGKRLLTTDGSNTIFFLDKDTYQKIGSIDVFDNNGPVDSLNELEVIDGKIFANIWQKDIVVVIDPLTGIVEATIDLSTLYPKRNAEADVMNGIAWDAAGKRLFVTGKKWDKLFEIRIKK